MDTDLHKLCLDLISKAKTISLDNFKYSGDLKSQAYFIEDPSTGDFVLYCYHLRLSKECDDEYGVSLYGSRIFLPKAQAKEIYLSLYEVYTLAHDQKLKEIEKQERARLQANIKKAQAFLLK